MKTKHMGLSEAFKKSYSYSSFLGHLIFKKVSTWSFVLILFLLMIPFTLIARFVAQDLKQFLIISYVYIFVNLLLTVILSVIKSLNLFKDLSRTGIDILVYSKSISRNNIILTKIGFLVFMGTIWSVLTFISFIVFYLGNFNYQHEVNYWYVSGFFSVIFTFLIFGFMTSVIALKASSKVAIIAPIITFIPLAVVGSIAGIVSTPANNRMAEYLNTKKPEYHSGTIGNVERFYLNNNQDEVFIIPKLEEENQKVDVRKENAFTLRQDQLLTDINSKAQSAASPWQAISWLSVPYQFIDVFATRDRDPIALNVNSQPNYLKNYLYANNTQSSEYNYHITKDVTTLKKYNVSANPQAGTDVSPNYLVPGLLRRYSLISEQNINAIKDRELVYARKNADNINVEFKEDNNIFADPSNLVGKIGWRVVKDTLDSPIFNAKAAQFYDNVLKNLFVNKNDLTDLEKKQEILTQISYITRFDNDKDQTFNAVLVYLDEVLTYLNNKQKKSENIGGNPKSKAVTLEEVTEQVDTILEDEIINTIRRKDLQKQLKTITATDLKSYIAAAKDIINSLHEQYTYKEQKNSFLSLNDDESVSPLLNSNFVNELENQMQKKVYLITSMIYWIYFNKQDSDILDYLLKNNNPNLEYTPSQIEVTIDGYVYYIGGYESYSLTQHSKENKQGLRTIVHRYELNRSKNFVFQNVSEVQSIKRSRKVVVKGVYSVIWISLAALLMIGTYLGYARKDYK
ncbi:ABC transporter permease [Ureaplasma sp. ES3154-GEN]|uniref:ABC transporter permease n=1 Tax=Ureaplasma sp. ES3154-GEN TaxID=2984844 RepID=UPI0021E71B9B|nr:ABC transporter permease [Ureaplasma sp. ES3154-GEN]MCV3743839.1 ABC transporter permease [Ureaplasma sp. ES3154-GEN]